MTAMACFGGKHLAEDPVRTKNLIRTRLVSSEFLR
jgi:hypothetical protein